MADLISYEEIKNNYSNPCHIPYDILLKTSEWYNLRTKILERDNSICTVCNIEGSIKRGKVYLRKPTDEENAEREKGEWVDFMGNGELSHLTYSKIYGIITDTPIILNVHHKYYIYLNKPWDYPMDAFVTVCASCHTKIHSNTDIKTYSNNTFENTIPLTPCLKCNGTGFLNEYHYHHDGICFRCLGRKYEEYIV